MINRQELFRQHTETHGSKSITNILFLIDYFSADDANYIFTGLPSSDIRIANERVITNAQTLDENDLSKSSEGRNDFFTKTLLINLSDYLAELMKLDDYKQIHDSGMDAGLLKALANGFNPIICIQSIKTLMDHTRVEGEATALFCESDVIQKVLENVEQVNNPSESNIDALLPLLQYNIVNTGSTNVGKEPVDIEVIINHALNIDHNPYIDALSLTEDQALKYIPKIMEQAKVIIDRSIPECKKSNHDKYKISSYGLDDLARFIEKAKVHPDSQLDGFSFEGFDNFCTHAKHFKEASVLVITGNTKLLPEHTDFFKFSFAVIAERHVTEAAMNNWIEDTNNA